MRDLKFRAYDEQKNEMRKSVLIEDLILRASTMDPNKFTWDYDIPLMQFTGIISTNDKEIFEGDIIQYENDAGKFIDCVEYNADMTCFVLQKFNSVYFIENLESKTVGSIYEESFSFEVVGNIYQNKELLK
jgi:uncharacterized phage protein (TIGR01671 family)